MKLNYNIYNTAANEKAPTLVGAVSKESLIDNKGKVASVVQKGIYRSDMQDIYALDTMRQIEATKYTKLADFKGKNSITREQAAKFFVMAWKATHPGQSIPTTRSSGCRLADQILIDATLLEYVRNACELGIMKGSKLVFNPQGTLTLSEAVTILIRMQYGNMNETNSVWYRSYFEKAYGVDLFAHFAYNPDLTEGTDTISREMIAFLIRRLLEINNITPKYYNTI